MSSKRRNQLFAVLAACAFGVFVVYSALDEPAPAGSTDQPVLDNAPSSRPGNPAVYDRIDGMVACADLQREFDIAISNSRRLSDQGENAEPSRGYANAALARMEELECFG